MAQFPFRDFLQDTEDGKKALTTANHVMTESGIWVPQTGSDDGAVNTRVTGSIFDVVRLIDEPTVVTSGTRIQAGIRQTVSDYVAFALSVRKSSAEGILEYRTTEGVYRMDHGYIGIEGSFDRGFTDKIGIIVSGLDIYFNNTSTTDETLEAVYLHLFRR